MCKRIPFRLIVSCKNKKKKRTNSKKLFLLTISTSQSDLNTPKRTTPLPINLGAKVEKVETKMNEKEEEREKVEEEK